MENLKIKKNQRELVYQSKKIELEKINQIYNISSGKNNAETINKNDKNKSKIGKFRYELKIDVKNINELKIIDKQFIKNNKNKAKFIIKNKFHNLFEKINFKTNTNYIIKIKFFDIIIDLDSMFKNCNNLILISSIQMHTKYLKNLCALFYGCCSL